ncbi:MAG: hypothetical protein KBG48_22070 [Kofleriaceae bacterium]|jgi:hypothetical protein|nr:hypothetical protein [Kofleriaceae bacterium]MBP9859959.1 hypothetical protein [Kofleriaceae bacterium]
MSKPAPARFAAIDPAALAAVAGGRRAAGGRSTSAADDQLMDTLSSIENSIRDLGRNQPKSNAMDQIMPLLALSMMNQPAAPQQVVICKKKRC